MHKHKESQSEYIEISGKQLEGRTYRDSNFQQHSAGASILLEAMMHLPPVSDFPLFWKKFQTLWKIVPVSPFPDFFRYFRFSSAKIYDDLFSSVSVHFPPVSRKLLFPLYFCKRA